MGVRDSRVVGACSSISRVICVCRVGVLRYAASQLNPDGSRRDPSGSAKALAR